MFKGLFCPATPDSYKKNTSQALREISQIVFDIWKKDIEGGKFEILVGKRRATTPSNDAISVPCRVGKIRVFLARKRHAKVKSYSDR